MLNLRKGFTLVEVILVVLILGIIAAIVIPRITYSRKEAKQAASDANVSAINAMIEYAHVKDDVPYPANQVEYENNIAGNTNYFPDGPPYIPGTTTHYTYNSTTKRVERYIFP